MFFYNKRRGFNVGVGAGPEQVIDQEQTKERGHHEDP